MNDKEIIEGKVEEIKKNTEEKFVGSKAFYAIIFLIVGMTFMFCAMKLNGNTITQKVINEDVKTTTLEETSDLKNGINNVYESTVYIEVSSDRSAIAAGSGFVYKSDDKYGYILTNYHVIDKGNKFVVTFTDGSEAEAQLVNGDEYYDIAILKVDVSKIKKVATLGNSSSIELGDSVFTVGAPLGKEYMGTITKGIISGVNRMVSVKLSSGTYLMEVIQTDASINSGNSGGPICDIRGDVIGITSSKLMGTGVEGMGFAIPINSVLSVIENMEAGNKVVRPYLGVQLVDISNTFALQYYYGINIGDVDFGAVISYIEEGKPADKAGLKVGDVIVELNGKKVEDTSHFKFELYKYSVGDKITVKYYRNNKISEATIELTEAIKNE